MTPEQEEILARVRARREAKEVATNTKFPVDIRPATRGDVFNYQSRSIQSMANPPLRLMTRAVEGVGGPEDPFGMREWEESVARGRRFMTGEWERPGEIDIPTAAGELTGGIAMTKGLGGGSTAVERIGQAILGGMIAAPGFAPLDEDTGQSMRTGAQMGAIVGPGFEAMRKGVEIGGPALRHVFSGPYTRASHMLRNALGDKRQAVVDALRNYKSRVTGEKPTAGQAAASAGSTRMSSLQKMVEEVDSDKYSGINEANRQARLAAMQAQGATPEKMGRLTAERTLATAPKREAALAAANTSKGMWMPDGVPVANLYAQIDDQLSRPEISTLAKKVLNATRKEIKGRSKGADFIDAEALYTIRKEIGNNVEKFAKKTASWDKKVAAGLQRDIQKTIDEQIEAVGPGWKNYLETYVEKTIPIENAQTANALVAALEPVKGEEAAKPFMRMAQKEPIRSAQTQAAADAVSDSLLRNRQMAAQARMGISGTREAMGSPRLPNTGMFSPSYQVFKSIVNRFSDRATKDVMEELANAFDDPGKVLVLLAKTDVPGPVQKTLYALSKQAQAGTAAGLKAEYSGDQF